MGGVSPMDEDGVKINGGLGKADDTRVVESGSALPGAEGEKSQVKFGTCSAQSLVNVLSQRGPQHSAGSNGKDVDIDRLGAGRMTFGEALSVTDGVSKQALSMLSGLPKRRKRQYLPGSFLEAQSYVNAREDAKKKQGVQTLGSDTVSVSAQKEGPYPGVVEGSGDVAAFWLYVEDYFRDICQEDVHELLGFLKPVEFETVLNMEPLGMKEGLEMVKTEEQGAGQGDGEFTFDQMTPGVSMYPGMEAFLSGRRSSRRVSSKKMADSSAEVGGTGHRRSQAQRDASAVNSRGASLGAMNSGSINASGAKMNEMEKSMPMSVTLTPEGAPAKTVLESFESGKLSELLSALTNLQNCFHPEIPSNQDEITSDKDAIKRRLEAIIGKGKQVGATRGIRHLWTDMLLNTPVPEHVKEAVTEPYYLDPPTSLSQKVLGNINVFDIAQEEYNQGAASEPHSPTAHEQQDSKADGGSKVDGDPSKHIHVQKVSIDVMKSIAEGADDQLVQGAKADELFKAIMQESKLLQAAPQDEIAAETLALQSELVSVMAANRARLFHILKLALADLAQQSSTRELLEEESNFVKSFFDKIEEAKNAEKRHRREMAQRQAMKIKGGAVPLSISPSGTSPGSNRPILGRSTTAHGVHIGKPLLDAGQLYDVLAQRNEEDESFCALCGDGYSAEPNMIIFCDRCDVAVHQKCYDVKDVPQHEWLCWPCKEYEDLERAKGKTQEEIRPLHMLPEQRKKLPGGSKDIKCLLCPLKYGAFRKTTDGAAWVHQTCAMWHPEAYLSHTDGSNVVEGVWDIPEKRFKTECDICGLTDGAIVPCSRPSCPYVFHVLCARNCGLYLTVQQDAQGIPHHRIYCSLHSKDEQEKDSKALALALTRQEQKKDKESRKKAAEELKKREMEALAMKEVEFSKLKAMRVNFESLRVLLDQCKRRERLKKLHSQSIYASFRERTQDPKMALGFIDEIQDLKNEGLSISGIIERIWPHYTRPATDATPNMPSMVDPEDHSKKKFKLSDITTSKHSTKTKGVLHKLNDSRTFTGRVQRRLKPKIEREKILSSSEAEELNRKLPPGIKYVPMDQINPKMT